MKILFLSANHYFPQLIGGTETSTHDTCLALAAGGHTPRVLAAMKPRGALSFGLRLRRHLLRDPWPADRHLGYEVFRVWDVIGALPALVEKLDPEVLVVVKNHAPLIAAARATGRRCVVYLHSVDFCDFSREPGLGFIANSEFTARRLHERFGFEATVIPPWIEPARYATETSREVALFVNPTRSKGVETVFALARLRPDIPFLICESWPLAPEHKAACLARAAQLGNVRWQTPTREMRRVYARARVLLVPSEIDEAWGRVVSEAQASGIPVIASDRGGLPEAVGPGGLVIEGQAEDALARYHAALSRLWDEPAAYRDYSQRAAMHARREAVQPALMIEKFLGALAS